MHAEFGHEQRGDCTDDDGGNNAAHHHHSGVAQGFVLGAFHQHRQAGVKQVDRIQRCQHTQHGKRRHYRKNTPHKCRREAVSHHLQRIDLVFAATKTGGQRVHDQGQYKHHHQGQHITDHHVHQARAHGPTQARAHDVHADKGQANEACHRGYGRQKHQVAAVDGCWVGGLLCDGGPRCFGFEQDVGDALNKIHRGLLK